MRSVDTFAERTPDRPILPWKFVVGAFVHFVIPVYLIAAVLATLLNAPPHPNLASLLAFVLRFSARFIMGYALATGLASFGAAILDPLVRARRARREATIPSVGAKASARRYNAAIARARGLLGDDARRLLDAIDATHWNHTDPRYQAVATDLAKVVGVAETALSSARNDRRAVITGSTIAALVIIAAALDTLTDEQRALDEGDVQTLARYVQIRYGPSDFAGGADS